jgi:hypothetical protein
MFSYEIQDQILALTVLRVPSHPGVELRANLKSISNRCYLFEVAFIGELTKETIHLPLGCLQGALLDRRGKCLPGAGRKGAETKNSKWDPGPHWM